MTRDQFKAAVRDALVRCGVWDIDVEAIVIVAADAADEYAARVAEEVSRPPLPWVLARKVKPRSDEKAAGL